MPDTTELVNNLYAQFGALAILTGAGWGVAWLLWRRLTALQDKYDDLSREIITQAAALNETARDLVQMERLEKLITGRLRD